MQHQIIIPWARGAPCGNRGRGHGRSAVAHLAGRALRDGLLPQYRTLDANAPSIHIAASLGFHRYATSVAVRFKG